MRSRAAAACVLAGCTVCGWGQVAANPDAPTSGLPAAVYDQQWARGNAKYDGQRAKLLGEVNETIAAGPFAADWPSLGKYSEPEWFRDAKFGIFIHWGVYSVPAFADEWYPRNMYMEGSKENKHQVATYGPLTKFGYKDFIPMFKAERFDPQAWAELFREAGARYVVPVFEHHDGFAMYDSGLSDWTAVKMGPKRDVDGELANAVRAAGMHLGASSHRVEHDFFLEGGRRQESDVNDPKYAGFYGPAHPRLNDGDEVLAQDWTYVGKEYMEDWLARSAEIVEKYHPDLVYFDWWVGTPAMRPYMAKFAAFYYNESVKRGTQGVLNYKLDAMREGTGTADFERGQLDKTRATPWQTDTSVSNASWGFVEHDTFKTPDSIVHQLVDIVSKNGNLLLNIGPKSDGTIPDEVKAVLMAVGGWLKVNGEAIYGTRPWTTFGEGPTKVVAGQFHDTETKAYTSEDFRFTAKGRVVYATEMVWPKDGKAVIHALGSSAGMAKVASVTLLGGGAVKFEQGSDGLRLELVGSAPTAYASCFKITFAGGE